AVSREGKHLWISRSLPVQAQFQIDAKVLHAFVGAAIISAPLTAMYWFAFSPPWWHLLLALILGNLASLAPQFLGLLFDMCRPLLAWTNPQHAVKNNLNVLIPLAVATPLFYLSFLIVKFAIKQNVGATSLILLLAIFHTLAGIISYYLTKRAAPTLYNRMGQKD
ncbi:MAG: hypothetical protein Q8N36_05960, partial [bacterium]|nr:hypothetical protein [bacterium]